jgi:hypothetical protein
MLLVDGDDETVFAYPMLHDVSGNNRLLVSGPIRGTTAAGQVATANRHNSNRPHRDAQRHLATL